MNKKIAITEDLADLFIALSLKENFCTFHRRNDHFAIHEADYILQSLTDHKKNTSDLFSMLSHLLILYENIELPILNTSFDLYGDITSIAKIENHMPTWFYGVGYPAPFEEEFFPDELAIPLKHLVINYCMKEFYNPDFLNKFAIETIGSLENLFSYIFDRYYNRKNLEIHDYIEVILDTMILHYFDSENPIEAHSDRGCVLMAFNRIQQALKNLLLIDNIARKGPYDFYTPAFSDFHSASNTNDAYCILKNQISMIMDEQPAFESLTEILKFRERKHHDIKVLRNEVTGLESLLVQGEREQAIQKAIRDVRNANQSLIKNTPVKSVARLATYISIPISLLEMYTFGTSYSIFISVVGTAAQFLADKSDSKSNWLFVAK